MGMAKARAVATANKPESSDGRGLDPDDGDGDGDGGGDGEFLSALPSFLGSAEFWLLVGMTTSSLAHAAEKPTLNQTSTLSSISTPHRR